MAVYIERESSIISLEEWIGYVNTDSELVLSESGKAVNSITRASMRFNIPGRVLWSDYEIIYMNGRIVCEGSSTELIKKLRAIGNTLSADVYDCGKKI